MEKPFKTATQKRQTIFLVSSFAFLSIYIFGGEVASIIDVGLSPQLKAKFVPTVLFWITVYLFLRYILDLSSELFNFTWHKNWGGEANKWARIMNLNTLVINLMKAPTSEFMVRQLRANNTDYKSANENVNTLIQRIQRVLDGQNTEQSEDEKMSEAIRITEDARVHILSFSKSRYWFSLWHLFRLVVGVLPFIGYVVLDVILPIALFCVVLLAAYSAPEWIKYENMSWLWIKSR